MSLAVDCDFPGGNVLVESVAGDRIAVRPDLRDTEGWWFWWNFRVCGAAGRTIRVDFADPKGPVGPHGAVTSTDRRDWRWLGGEFDRSHFVAEVPPGADEAYFAFSFPYQLADWDRFAARHGARADVRLAELAVTEKGRSSPLLIVGDPEMAAHNVIVACRHHACEAMASYVLEGIVEGVLAPERRLLRESAAFTFVPFMDLDGVEAGDQGKSRRPHDHNRDYTEAPIYAAVRAMQTIVRDLAGRNLSVYLDLHCPWIRGSRDESVFLVEPPAPWAAEVGRFREVLRSVPTGPVPYTGKHDIAFGVDWNSGASPNSRNFICRHGGPGLRAGFGLEFSYSLTEGAPMTPEGARLFGRAMAQALEIYLAS